MSSMEVQFPNITPENIIPTTGYVNPFTTNYSYTRYIYYFYVTGSLLAGIILLSYFYIISQRNRQFQLSNTLKIHLITWIICMAGTLVFFINILLYIFLPEIFYVDESSLWGQIKGTLQITSAQIMPLSTTFVLIDRIEAILFVSVSLSRRRQLTQIGSVFAITALFTSTFLIIFLRSYTFKTEDPACGFSCRIATNIDDVLIVKIVISGINLVLGFYFVYLYIRYTKNLKIRQEKKTNYTVLLMFISDFFLIIIPTGLYLIFKTALIPVINTNSSFLITTGYATDGFISALVYLHTRNKAVETQKSLSVQAKNNISTKITPSTNFS